MMRLRAVEEAMLLMKEATGWSVLKWLREKKKVRKAADHANEALDKLNHSLKSAWSARVLDEYRRGLRSPESGPAWTALVQQCLKVDTEARKARSDAERTFDEAERELSTSLAREGCRKAIRSWELHEQANALAEKLTRA